MDSNNENIDDARSKIEKIRIDLEKKLAALEAARMKSATKGVSGGSIEEEVVINKNVKENEEVNIDKEIVEEVPVKPIEKEPVISKESKESFIEEISDFDDSSSADNLNEVEENNVVDDLSKNDKSNNDTFFEINDIIEDATEGDNVVKEEIVKKEKAIVATTAASDTSKEKTKNKIGLAATTVVPAVEKKVKKKSKKIAAVKKPKKEKEEKEDKKGGIGILAYLLGIAAIFVLGFLSWNYLKSNKSSSNETDKVLSEYKNRRYRDSIELADANNQYLDFQKRFADSIALANQIEIKGNPDAEDSKNTSEKKPTSTKNTSNNNRTKPVIVKNNAPIINNTVPISTSTTDTGNNTLVNTSNAESKTVEEVPEEVVKVEEKKPPVKKPKTETLTSIEKSPVYPGCGKKGSELLKKKCLMSKIQKFVAKKFNSNLSQDLGLKEGRKKINVSFIIDRFGNVNVLKVRAQHKVLEKEAIRVVNSLPKMKPGRKGGKSEPVIYNLPIVYFVEY